MLERNQMKNQELEKLPLEIRLIPLMKEDLESRQQRLSILLFKGAKNAAAKKVTNPPLAVGYEVNQ
jgi:hypothetical protein